MMAETTRNPIREFERYMRNLSDEKLRTAFREYLDQKDTGSYQHAVTIKEIRKKYAEAFSYKADFPTITKVILEEIAIRWYGK